MLTHKRVTIFREEAKSTLVGFPVNVLSRWLAYFLGFTQESEARKQQTSVRMLLFRLNRKPEYLEKNPQSRPEPTTDSTYIWQETGIEPGQQW